jgi:hypothetical protein
MAIDAEAAAHNAAAPERLGQNIPELSASLVYICDASEISERYLRNRAKSKILLQILLQILDHLPLRSTYTRWTVHLRYAPSICNMYTRNINMYSRNILYESCIRRNLLTCFNFAMTHRLALFSRGASRSRDVPVMSV